MNRGFLVSLVLLSNASLSADGVDQFKKGIKVVDSNLEELAYASLPFSVVRSGHSQAQGGYVYGFIHVEERNVVYSIDSKSVIATAYPARSLIGSWPLERWQAEFVEPEIIANSTEWGTEYPLDYVFEPSGLAGCMANYPMRHGDIEGDGKNELIIIPSDDVSTNWVVFSLDLHKVIFSIKADFNDVLTDISGTDPELFDRPEKWQYWSKRGLDGATAHSMRGALKAFAKLYFGDFDSNGHFDIVVWRRLYESRQAGDPIPGFVLKQQRLMHYEATAGEYELRDSSSALIQGWLSANSLTWKKGYPDKSECVGHENEMIPEMHDAALNDPVVLQ